MGVENRGICALRAFVRPKQASASQAERAVRLAELEDRTEALAMNHETSSRNTRNSRKQVFDALRALDGATRSAQAAPG